MLNRYLILIITILLAGCGGTSDGASLSVPTDDNRYTGPSTGFAPSPAINYVPAIVDKGPMGQSLNQLFVSVKVCIPGTTSCQTVDHVMVDTGSTGLRLFKSKLNNLPFPPITTNQNNRIAECVRFATSYLWGALARADVYLGGETAMNIPMQVIDDGSNSLPAPANCSSNGGASQGSIDAADANGVIGVAYDQYDCDSTTCGSSIPEPIVYYSCNGITNVSTCTGTTVTTAQTVVNPISAFSSVDNNGFLISLPATPETGSTAVSGMIYFGINTQANNQTGAATIFGDGLSAIYKGINHSAFLDTGSHVLYFDDNSIPLCSGCTIYSPESPLRLSGVMTDSFNTRKNFDFSVVDFNSYDPTTAVAALGGPVNINLGPIFQGKFDFGLPFYFGRNVYHSVQNEQGQPAIVAF